MGLTAPDKKYLEEELKKNSTHFQEIQELKDKLIYQKLDSILLETGKLTQLVNTHEQTIKAMQMQLPHTVDNCPQKKIIEQLRNESVEKHTVKKFMSRSIAVTSIITGIIFTVLNFIINFYEKRS